MSQCWELDLAPNQKLVLLAFADHANDEGLFCFPSIARIAWKSGYSVRQAKAVIAKLRKAGILQPIANFDPTTGKGGGRGLTVSYRVSPENHAKIAPFIRTGKGCSSERKGCSPTPERVQPAAPQSSGTVKKEPSEKSSGDDFMSELKLEFLKDGIPEVRLAWALGVIRSRIKGHVAKPKAYLRAALRTFLQDNLESEMANWLFEQARDILADEPIDYGSLAERLKESCGQHRIPYDSLVVGEAIKRAEKYPNCKGLLAVSA